ncbi:MAG: hypothetical protein QXS02_03880 [Candidatus Thermoplasmatota archaeon]
MKRKKIFGTKAADKITAVFIATTIIMMLTIGVGIIQFHNSKIKSEISVIPPKKEIKSIEYAEIPVYTPCSTIVDPVTGKEYTLKQIYETARPYLATHAGIIGCGNNAQQSSQQTQQQSNVVGGHGFALLDTRGTPIVPNQEKKELEIEGLNEEQVLQRLSEIDAWIYSDCNSGTPPPNYGFGPGEWHLGPAMMACAFLFLRMVGVVFTAASIFAVGLFARFCNYGLALAVLWEFGLSYGPELTQAYIHCVEFLTGQPFP